MDLPTRVNCEQLIDEIIETNLNENDQSVNENEVGLQLFVAKDGTAKLGNDSLLMNLFQSSKFSMTFLHKFTNFKFISNTGSRSNAKSKSKALRMVKSSNEVPLLSTTKQPLQVKKVSK